MCCHLARPTERLALDPKLHQGLRRKNQPGLVCSSTDYKGLGGFFYLPLWYGPNHGCQFSPLQLGSPSAFNLCFTHPSSVPDLCFLLFYFSFSYHACLPCIHLHLTCSVCIPILVTDKKHRTTYYCRPLLLGISNLPEYAISYDGINHYSVLCLLLRSAIGEVKSTSYIS